MVSNSIIQVHQSCQIFEIHKSLFHVNIAAQGTIPLTWFGATLYAGLIAMSEIMLNESIKLHP